MEAGSSTSLTREVVLEWFLYTGSAKRPYLSTLRERLATGIASARSGESCWCAGTRDGVVSAIPFSGVSQDRAGEIRVSKSGVSEMLNLQPRGSLAKPYQVKQIRAERIE